MTTTTIALLKSFEAAGLKVAGIPVIQCDGQGTDVALHVQLTGDLSAFERIGMQAYLVGDVDEETGVEVVYAHSEAEAKAIGATWLDFKYRHVKRAPEYDHYLAQGGATDRELFEDHGWHFPCTSCENEAVTSLEGKWVGKGPMCIDCLEAHEGLVIACRRHDCQHFQGHQRPGGELLCSQPHSEGTLIMVIDDPMPETARPCAQYLSAAQMVLTELLTPTPAAVAEFEALGVAPAAPAGAERSEHEPSADQ
jgi:hypothetical protein